MCVCRYAHLLPVLVANLGKRFKKSHTGSGEEGFTTGVPTFKLLPRPYLSLNEDAIALFPGKVLIIYLIWSSDSVLLQLLQNRNWTW